MAAVSFHFHGYQPGDVVRWLEPDPLKPPRFEERRSPVAHTVGGDRVAGANWTDAVLRAYGRMEAVLERATGAAAVDVEPQTLAWLLGKDPDAYRQVVTAYETGRAGLVLTPPFHPILPHHHRLERESLFDMMIDFFAPLLRRTRRPVGLWFPEAAYSAETLEAFLAAARRAPVRHDDLPDLTRDTYLLLDSRQLVVRPDARSSWCRTNGLPLVTRDPALSGEFAFGASPAADFVRAVDGRGADSLHIASDLESLLAKPAQAARFEEIVSGLRSGGHNVSSPLPPSHVASAKVVEFSSWSDYDEHLSAGHTSDTRWTAIRHFDGLVVGRVHRGHRLSQLWKHAFTLVTEQIETAVRRAIRDQLGDIEVERKRDAVRRLAVAYGRHLWSDHYRALGLSSSDTDFARAAEAILDGAMDVERAAYLTRSYVMMLMGLRSDSRFWDNPDTRVTFQNVVCLTQSLLDAAEAWRRAGKRDRGEPILELLLASLIEFPDAYERLGLAGLHGVEGWETLEDAWHESMQSEVPQRSTYGLVRRASLFALGEEHRHVVGRRVAEAEIVADAGHIVGEAHGEWENGEWCEHRQP